MKLKNTLLIKLLGFVGAWLIRGWMSTIRYRIYRADGKTHPTNAKRERHIYAIWHETLLFPTAFPTNVHALISKHGDGELIAQVCRHLRFKTIRGSTTRGGLEALRQLTQISKHSNIMITPDGPRGPRRKIQLGLIFLASQTGLPIIPCGFAFRHAWRFKSWDRFALPKPWTTAYGVTGQPIFIPRGLKRRELSAMQQLVEQAMLLATEAAERWAETGSRLPPMIRNEELCFRKTG